MKKDSFIFVKCNNVKYPDGYLSNIKEVAAHFDTYFNSNEEIKRTFLDRISKICFGEQKRFFVPEVNSGEEDLRLVLTDLF